MPREIPVLRSKQQREVDRRAYATGLAPGALMESAGRNAAELMQQRIEMKKVIVLAGKGGNGGDAFVVARHLFQHGVEVRVFALCTRAELSPTTASMASLLEQAAPGSLLFLSDDLTPFVEAFDWADCMIDGLFGSGLNRSLANDYAQAVKMVNERHLWTISLDLPSGLCSDQGSLLGEAVKADMTIAMEFLKPAHLFYPARSYCGRVEIAKVDYPCEALAGLCPLAYVLERVGARDLLPARQANGHKGTFGRVLVVAGSTGMSGAAILCGQGALRVGAGLVTLASPRVLNPILETAFPEAITLPLPDEEGHLHESAIESLGVALERADVVAIGPGLSRHPAVGQVVLTLLQTVKVPIVLDADGLFPLNSRLDLLEEIGGRAVLTPHPGELSHLIDRPADEIDEDRIEVARTFAHEYGVVLVLKGKPTAIGRPDDEVYLNTTGNTGLATGGSGDVLTGIIAGLIAGGVSPADAAILGAFLHGYTADLLARDRAERSILPSDLISTLPLALAEVERH